MFPSRSVPAHHSTSRSTPFAARSDVHTGNSDKNEPSTRPSAKHPLDFLSVSSRRKVKTVNVTGVASLIVLHGIIYCARRKKLKWKRCITHTHTITMDMSLEREGGVIGTLFQQIINDMKVRVCGKYCFHFRITQKCQCLRRGQHIEWEGVGGDGDVTVGTSEVKRCWERVAYELCAEFGSQSFEF